MLDDAIDAWLSSVSERASYEPLLAMLRTEGYEDLHLVHGQREFGKDLIGKRGGEQWGWQVKAGDIGQSDWREIDGQLTELRTLNLGHGSFDLARPRRAVLLTTGRLTGNAPDLFREHNRQGRERGEVELELWDRDTLIGKLSGNPHAALRSSLDAELLGALASVQAAKATMDSIETFSRRWTDWEPERLASVAMIEAAILCETLKQQQRLDLACHLALSLLRGVWASTGLGDSSAVADAAGRLFETYAIELWSECDDRLLAEKGLVGFSGASAWVTYPIRCARIGELLGLLSIRLRDSDAELSGEIAAWIARFAQVHPALARPVSDAYALSLIPAVLTIASVNPVVAVGVLREGAVWLTKMSEPDQFGLAGIDADPAEQIGRLLGNTLESVQYPRRPSSLLAAVLLDLCAVLGEAELYADALNDFRACDICPQSIRLGEGRDCCLRDGDSNGLELNVDYAAKLPGGQPPAAHHSDEAGSTLCAAGRAWDLLAIGAALRDRYFVRAITAVIAASAGHQAP